MWKFDGDEDLVHGWVAEEGPVRAEEVVGLGRAAEEAPGSVDDGLEDDGPRGDAAEDP